MKFESIAGCIPAAAVMTAAVVVILAGCSARPVQTSSTAPVRPDSVLLTAEEANTTLGSSDMQLIGPINHETFTKNLPTSVSHPDCLSTANVALDPVYSGSGYAAIIEERLADTGPDFQPAHVSRAGGGQLSIR
jgi:PknH-like extracellular domain